MPLRQDRAFWWRCVSGPWFNSPLVGLPDVDTELKSRLWRRGRRQWRLWPSSDNRSAYRDRTPISKGLGGGEVVHRVVTVVYLLMLMRIEKHIVVEGDCCRNYPCCSYYQISMILRVSHLLSRFRLSVCRFISIWMWIAFSLTTHFPSFPADSLFTSVDFYLQIEWLYLGPSTYLVTPRCGRQS